MKVQEKQTKSVQFWYKLAELIGAQWIARAVAVVSIVFVSALIFAQVAPAAGEAWVYNITLFSGILTACLLAVVCLMVLSVGVNLTTLIIGAGIRQARDMNAPTQSLLPATTDADLIIVEQPGEQDFSGRMNYELSHLTAGRYAAVVRFRNPKILYIMNGKESLILRDELSQGSAAAATTETMDAYDAFVTDAIAGINDHFRTVRAQVSDNLRTVFADGAARIASVVLLIALPVALFSQSKTQRVKAGVPQIAGEVVAKGVGVQYKFASGEITRTADGTANVAQLVAQNRPGADADNMGALKSVVVGTTVFEAKKNEAPQPLFTSNMVPHNMAIQVPDSLKVVEGIEGAKQSFYFYKSKLWTIIQPVIDFIFWLLLSLLPLIAAVVFWLNVGARSAGANKNLGPKVKEKEIRMAALAWEINFYLAGGVLLLFSISTFFWEIHPFWAVVLTGAGGVIAYWLINRLTPNPENKAKQNDRNDFRNNGPWLNSGR